MRRAALAALFTAGVIGAATSAAAQNLFFASDDPHFNLAKIDGDGNVSHFPRGGFYNAGGIRFGPDGNLYAYGYGRWVESPGFPYGQGSSVLRINSKGYASYWTGFGDGTGGIDFDSAGNLFTYGNSIGKHTPAGVASQFLPGGLLDPSSTYSGGMAIDASDNLYVANWDGKVRKITPGGVVSTFVDLGPTIHALSVEFESSGDLFVSAYDTNLSASGIARVDPLGNASIFCADPALLWPKGMYSDASNNLYVANQSGFNVLKIDPTGTSVSEVAQTLPPPMWPVRASYLDEAPAGFDPPAIVYPSIMTGEYLGLQEVVFAPEKVTALGVPTRNSQLLYWFGEYGEVSFTAKTCCGMVNATAANNVSLWSTRSWQFEKLKTRRGAFAPDEAGAPTAAIFRDLSNPVFTKSHAVVSPYDYTGYLAFRATLKPGVGGVNSTNNVGLWSNFMDAGPLLHLVARKGDVAPDTGGALFRDFTSFALPELGDIVFVAKLKSGTGAPPVSSTNDVGLWAFDTLGDLRLVAREGDVDGVGTIASLSVLQSALHSPGQSRSYSADGSLVYKVTYTDSTTAIYRADKSTITAPTLEAAAGDPVPSLPVGATFREFGLPARNNNGRLVFMARLAGAGITPINERAIYLGDPGAEAMVIRWNDFAPDAGGAPTPARFRTFSGNNLKGGPVLNNADEIAFRGVLRVGVGGVTATDDTGLWSTKGGSLHLVAREGDPAPGAGGAKFLKFVSFALPDLGDVVFLAQLRPGTGTPAVTGANSMGIWGYDKSGALRLILRTGDAFPIGLGSKTISEIQFLESVKYSPDQNRSFSPFDANLVSKVRFTDGNSAILRIERPFCTNHPYCV